jgi:hypothetical protein
MATDVASLQIGLQDVGDTAWWKGLLAAVASQYGNAYLRFVGRVDGEVRYTSPTLPRATHTRHAAPAGRVGTRDEGIPRGAAPRPRKGRPDSDRTK